jgi:hypothetical protein
VLVEINNECNTRYEHAVLQPPRVHELIARVHAVDVPKEVIVVDDCSTDGTREVLESLNGRYENMRVIRQPRNRGKGAAPTRDTTRRNRDMNKDFLALNQFTKPELDAIFADWHRAEQEYNKVLIAASNRADKRKAQAPNPMPFAQRLLNIAEKYPGTQAELTALWWIVCHTPNAEAGKKAYDRLAKGRVASADLGELAAAFERNHEFLAERKAFGLAPIVLDRVKRNPDHAKAAWLLNWVCSACWDDKKKAIHLTQMVYNADLFTCQACGKQFDTSPPSPRDPQGGARVGRAPLVGQMRW